MAEGPPLRNQNSGINIDVTEGGTQMGPILIENDIQGQFTCSNNYNDVTINIRNEGSLSNQPILKGSRFGGNVDVEQNINIQEQINNEGRDDDHSGINIDVTDGGVHMGAILSGNTFKRRVTCRTNYSGPPAREGAATVVAKQLNVFQTGNDGINISNKGSLSHQTILQNNTFEDTVDLDQNINTRSK